MIAFKIQSYKPVAGQIIHLTANPAIPLPIIHGEGQLRVMVHWTMDRWSGAPCHENTIPKWSFSLSLPLLLYLTTGIAGGWEIDWTKIDRTRKNRLGGTIRPAAGQIIHLTANPAIPLPIIHGVGQLRVMVPWTMGWKKWCPSPFSSPLLNKWGTSTSVPELYVKHWRNNFL